MENNSQEETDFSIETEEMSDEELDLVSGGTARHSNSKSGAEVSMIELQSVVSQRGMQLQLTTGMLSSMHEATKSTIGNIR